MALVTSMDFARAVGGGTTVIPTEGLPTPGEIDALARRLDITFPADYRAFLAGCGSMLIQVHEDIWPPAQLGNIAPHWQQTRYELRVFGVCSEVDWMRIDVEAERFRGEQGLALVPVFAWANTSDRICFDRQGRLVEWFRDGDDGGAALDESFEAVCMRLINEQCAYKDEILHPMAAAEDPEDVERERYERETPIAVQLREALAAHDDDLCRDVFNRAARKDLGACVELLFAATHDPKQIAYVLRLALIHVSLTPAQWSVVAEGGRLLENNSIRNYALDRATKA